MTIEEIADLHLREKSRELSTVTIRLREASRDFRKTSVLLRRESELLGTDARSLRSVGLAYRARVK